MDDTVRKAVALIEATVGRLQLGGENPANDADEREWCASLARDLLAALGALDTLLKAKPCCICTAAPGADHAGYCSESW
jgi:hypothetical protein